MGRAAILAPLAALTLAVAGHAAPPASPAGGDVEPVNLTCDAIQFRGALDMATSKEIEPIHSLDGVAAVLKKHNVAFDRGKASLTIGLPSKARAEIDSLPPGEPIVLPAKGGGVVCVLIPSADSI